MRSRKIVYGSGTVQTEEKLGRIRLHSVETITGAKLVQLPEHYVSLLDSGVTASGAWEGDKLPRTEYAPGTAMFIPAGTLATTTYLSNPYKESIVRIPVDIFRQAVSGAIDYDRLPMRFFSSQDPQLVGIARQLIYAAHAPAPFPLLVESLASSLAIATMVALSPEVEREAKMQRGGFYGARRKRVLDHIEAHLSEQITLAELAQVAAMSTHHFLRCFKSEVGRTPFRYILERRVDLACRLLATTTLPVQSVALACGFSTQSHFTTAFKKLNGRTPSAFRREVS